MGLYEDTLSTLVKHTEKWVHQGIDVDDQNTPALRKILAWYTKHPITRSQEFSIDTEKSLYLKGFVGTGKSIILKALKEMMPPGKVFSIYNCKDIELEWKEHGAKAITPYKANRDMAFDDLGEEKASNNYGDSENPMITIISYRYRLFIDHGTKTYFTSNIDKIQDRYGEAIASRMSEMCNVIQVGSKDKATSIDRRRSAKALVRVSEQPIVRVPASEESSKEWFRKIREEMKSATKELAKAKTLRTVHGPSQKQNTQMMHVQGFLAQLDGETDDTIIAARKELMVRMPPMESYPYIQGIDTKLAQRVELMTPEAKESLIDDVKDEYASYVEVMKSKGMDSKATVNLMSLLTTE